MDDTRTRITKAIQFTNTQFAEREHMVSLIWAAFLAQFHVWLVGPPGSAKSMLIRYLAAQITDSRYAENLMSKFTKYEQVFGPLKLSKLKQDVYEHDTDGYLPTAHVYFADEGGRANVAITEAMLTVMNERFFQNGKTRAKVPTFTILSGSNTVLTDAEQAAFVDRFLAMVFCEWVRSDSALHDLMGRGAPKVCPHTVTLGELAKAQDEVKRIHVPDPFKDAVISVKRGLSEKGITHSTRRWLAIVSGLKAFAWMDGDASLQVHHLDHAINMLWQRPEHRTVVEGVVGNQCNPLIAEAVKLKDRATIVLRDMPASMDEAGAFSKAGRINSTLTDVLADLKKIIDSNPPARTTAVRTIHRDVKSKHDEMLRMLRENSGGLV